MPARAYFPYNPPSRDYPTQENHMKRAIQFCSAAAQSGAYLYREMAVSALQLLPEFGGQPSAKPAKPRLRPSDVLGREFATR